MNKTLWCAGALVFLFASAPRLASAQTGSEQWEFTVTPFLWGIGIDGNLSFGPRELPVEVPAKDLLKSLDFGLMANFEARKGKLLIVAEGMYADLGKEVESIQIGADRMLEVGPFALDLKTTIIESSVGYQLAESFHVMAGVRGFAVSPKIQGPLGGTVEADGGWVDPIVGGRFRKWLGDKWMVNLRGDVGGFGAGSNFAWFLSGVVGYRLNDRLALDFGYRAWDIDYKSDDEIKKVDITFSGFGAGLSIFF